MSTNLELHFENASFVNDAGVEIHYQRYYVEIKNQYNGEVEKVYLQAKDESKYKLKSYLKALLKKN